MLTLSDYFPKGTEHFYSFPIGDTSYFYNEGDPVSEELISARLLACAGDDVKVVIYDSTIKDGLFELLKKNSDLSFLSKDKIIILPKTINQEVSGIERNELITEALVKQTSSGNLIMAQPILDDRLINKYQIDPKLTTWLNDKKNLDKYVSSEFLPERYAYFLNGKEFFNSKTKIPMPCVVKMSASSSGEGVRLCKNIGDLKKAKKDFQKLKGTVFIEKLIPYVYNLCFHFGIPHGKTWFFPPHIIGHSHQVVTESGKFLGGFIFKEWDKKIEQIKKNIEIEILPKIQEMGWYGVGGLDVLIDKDGKFYIIDSNFRTTGTMAYIFLFRQNLISKSMVSLTATFKGSEGEFVKKVLSLNKGKNKILTIISLTKKDDEYRFNTALLFDRKEELPSLATKLTEIGVKSEVLEMLKQKI